MLVTVKVGPLAALRGDLVDVLLADPPHVILELLEAPAMALDMPQRAPLILVSQIEDLLPDVRVALRLLLGF